MGDLVFFATGRERLFKTSCDEKGYRGKPLMFDVRCLRFDLRFEPIRLREAYGVPRREAAAAAMFDFRCLV